MPRKKQLSAIDLFSGCGGLTLGLKHAGFRVRGAVEIDPLAVETYRKNHTGVRVWKADITKLSVKAMMEKLDLRAGELDLLAGCPPCQGFSTLTTLNGRRRSSDPRNDLIFEFLRFVRVMRPRAIMLENVPRLAKKKRLHKVVKSLEGMGYKTISGILDAAKYGVPQRRRRYILMGALDQAPSFARESRAARTVREALQAAGRLKRKDELQTLGEKRSDKVLKMIRRIPKNGGSRTDLGARSQLTCHKDSDGFKDIYGRMRWSDVAPTITGGCCNPSKGRFLHPVRDRCITLREAALLQSFPKSYFFSLKRGKFAAAEMIGNALPPEFIRRHAASLGRTLKRQPT